jgi:ribulose-5-phosphate 4-epimerase/fuculose-1-phosphate aldolase
MDTINQDRIFKIIQAIGRAALTFGVENSHSGNIAVKCKDENGDDVIAITATGSQKGELSRDRICFPALDKINFGHFKSSTETDIHALIMKIPGVNASIHGHTRSATVVTLDDSPMPKTNPRVPMIPVDPLGMRYFGEVPVDWFPIASGSKEMAETVAERLKHCPVCIVQTHGTFARGESVSEAFFNLCTLEYSGKVLDQIKILGLDKSRTRDISGKFKSQLKKQLPDYHSEKDHICDFRDEPETVEIFRQTGFRIFESQYSPFHTGSMSIRCSKTMLYLPKASMPHDLNGPMLEVGIDGNDDDHELAMHRTIYSNTPLKSVLHCYMPEIDAVVLDSMLSGSSSHSKIIPIDVEGGFLYPSVPVLPFDVSTDELCRAILEYRMAIVQFGGVWSAGEQSMSEALRHISSIKDICFYRIMAKRDGLNLSSMEPESAKNW